MTYEFLSLASVLDADIGLATLVEDSEGEVLHIGLDLRVLELAADETLGVEDTVISQSVIAPLRQGKIKRTCCEGSSRSGFSRHLR